MNSRSLIFTFLFSVISFVCFAQNGAADEVHLKNGSIFKGEILTYKQGEILTLKITDGQIVELKDSDIQKIIQSESDIADTVEEVNDLEVEPIEKVPFEYKTSGWYNTTFISFFAGNDGTDREGNGDFKLGSGLNNIVGKQLNPFVGLGLGVGLDNYSRRGETILPIFVELRGYPFKKAKQLYYSVSAGYGFAFKRENFGITEANGGYLVHPAIGFRLGTPDGTNVNIDLGYRIQKAFFREQLLNGDVDERDILFRRIAVRVGLTLWK